MGSKGRTSNSPVAMKALPGSERLSPNTTSLSIGSGERSSAATCAPSGTTATRTATKAGRIRFETMKIASQNREFLSFKATSPAGGQQGKNPQSWIISAAQMPATVAGGRGLNEVLSGPSLDH